ncbi:hypothetical protein IW261DRAFT_1599661 [Armillaria novae-zelandiae]|uniref:Uncharacterized protein n=1 Tax=Armillaria novae-zelandiae TaxID=153914 RepID=A0AA39N851_9AGAR|nr:hypothetical protein IW261DRAFT_1599661 [Armillaria novae-zelandiae]
MPGRTAKMILYLGLSLLLLATIFLARIHDVDDGADILPLLRQCPARRLTGLPLLATGSINHAERMSPAVDIWDHGLRYQRAYSRGSWHLCLGLWILDPPVLPCCIASSTLNMDIVFLAIFAELYGRGTFVIQSSDPERIVLIRALRFGGCHDGSALFSYFAGKLFLRVDASHSHQKISHVVLMVAAVSVARLGDILAGVYFLLTFWPAREINP